MMMDPSRAKYSGDKIPSRSDLRVEGARGGSTSNFKLDFINIRGINSNINSVHQHLQHEKPHILVLTETQVKSTGSFVHLLCPNYELHTRFRFKGGLCVFARSDLSCQREKHLEAASQDVIWLRIASEDLIKFVCCVYLSPNSSSFNKLFENLAETFDVIQETHPDSEVVFLGDFNVHNSDWLKFSGRTNDAGRRAEAFAISRGLAQLVDEPTRIPDATNQQANTLDLLLTTNPDAYMINVRAPIGKSDHKLISTTCTFAIPPPPPPIARNIWHYNLADWEGLRMFYSSFPWADVCFKSGNPSTIAQEVSEVILAGVGGYIPSSVEPTVHGKPWFGRCCAQAATKKNAAYKRWRRNPSEETRSLFVTARNNCNRIIDEAKERYDKRVRNRLLDCPTSSKSFWSFAKTIGKNFTYSAFPPLENANGSIAVSAKEKADLFSKMFASNSTIDDRGREPPVLPHVDTAMAEIYFRPKNIRKILLQLDTRKASGPDGVSSIVLKTCASELTPVLAKLFTLSYSGGVFPESWKTARVQPIPKKGKKTIPANYRPISLISVLSKVMEKAVNIEMVKYLENNKIISDRQYGFRQGRSTGDLLSYVNHIWTSALENYGESRTVALDISKAFDRVWHRALLNKLSSYGFPPGLCRWLSSFLENRSLHVVVDGVASEARAINAGVPQGSILSPTLFLIHINDLLDSTANPIYSFADDSTLVASYTSKRPISAANALQRSCHQINSINNDLDTIANWGMENMVQFNATKTQMVTFSKKGIPFGELPRVRMSGQDLTPSSSLSILGVTASANFSWHNHVASIAKAAAQKLGFLFRAKRYFSANQLLLLYKAQVRPALEYCSHVWSSAPKHTLALLDAIQERAVRLIDDSLLTNSLQTLEHRRRVADLSLFYRYYHGRCSESLILKVPSTAIFGRTTRFSDSVHPFAVHLVTPRTSKFKESFFWRAASLWNALPARVFPSSYNLSLFKRRVHHHLSPRTHDT